MSNNKRAIAALLVAGVLFAWGLAELLGLRIGAGDVYPAYSSLRSDPDGAQVLFDSLAALPGYAVTRGYRDVREQPQHGATVVYLAEHPVAFGFTNLDELKELEKMASTGLRFIIALAPVRPLLSAEEPPQNPALEQRWGIKLEFTRRAGKAPSVEPDRAGTVLKTTALVMKAGGQPVPWVEKPFGSGAVVLVANAYPFCNEALARERDADLIARLLGSNKKIIFDEYHFGLTESSSIAMLARKYRLTGLAIGLLLLAALFIWRNSSTLLPARKRSDDLDAPLATARDSVSALHHLLRRNIPEPKLIDTCLAEWERSRLPASFSPDRMAAVRLLADSQGGRQPVELYRRLHNILTERN